MAQYPIFPDLKSFPGSVNFQVEEGRAMPAFDHTPMANSSDVLNYFQRELIETTNPTGNPRQYAFGNQSVFYHEDGVRTTDQTFSDVITGGAVVDDGTGGKLLLVGFGTGLPDGVNQGNASKLLAGGAWVTNSAADLTKATFWKIITVGPDAYAATGSGASGIYLGRTNLGEYKVAKCVFGTDPRLAINWGNIQPVGTPEWAILEMAPLRDSLCVAKADGLWYWNGRVKRFINALDRIKFQPHPLNGKGMTSGENGVWYPMADGRLFFFDGVTVREETPWKSFNIPFPRDVMTARISAVADRGDVVAARMDAFYNSVAAPQAASALGMRVFTVTGLGQTVTEITSPITDGSIATGYNLTTNSLGANATDKLVIGLKQPAEGFIVRVTNNPNGAVNSFATPQCSNGSGGWTALGNIVDFTILRTAGKSLAFVAFPPGASQSYLGWDSIRSYDLSAIDTFNGIAGLYWYRFGFATTTPFNNNAQIDELEPISSRGGWPNSGVVSSTTNLTHRDRAGGLGHIYIGRRSQGRILWQDQYAINDMGAVFAMGWTAARSGATTNNGQPLLLWGRWQQTIMAEGITRDPSRTPYPMLVQPSATKPCPYLAFRRMNFGNPAQRHQLNAVNVQTEWAQPGDKMTVYAWWDNEDKIYELDTLQGGPGTWNVQGMMGIGYGRELNLDIAYQVANQNTPVAPQIVKVILDMDDVPGTFDMPQAAGFQTPDQL